MSRIVTVSVKVAVETPNKRDEAWAKKYIREALDAKNRVREITIKVEEPKPDASNDS